jgi:2-keto-4-pentenoate hydratase/2-oxohepta-3-ene-1,7-dioic acid hydratase in catechol pathway
MKIFCVGRNYVEHAKELNNDVPTEPVIFLKPKTAFLNHSASFYYPEFTNELHYEIELVLRISKNGKYVSEANAAEYYNAITVGIDFTARDVQQELKKAGLPWEKAKAWDNSALVGEFINLKPDMLNKPLTFTLEKNGETVQKGNSRMMIFSFPQIISHVSTYFSLNIGDLVFTGTPAGVGECVVGDVLTGYLEDKKLFETVVR